MLQQLTNCIKYFGDLILDDINCNCWIAGGALRDYFSLGYCSSDVDMFFPSAEEYQKAANFFLSHNLRPTFANERVTNYIWNKHKIQLVKTHYFSSPQEAINSFDFTVTCCATDNKEIFYHEAFFIDLAKKRLSIVQLPYPLSTLQRLQKYIKKGYTICNGGLLEIAKAIQKLDLDNPSVNTFEFYPDGSERFLRID